MNNEPFISVTVTSYNYEKYIKRQLDSIAAQTFRDFEIVISDDCSSDNSVQVIKDFIIVHPELSITFLQNRTNLGLSANRNNVLDHARGTYIMFCDSDDWMDPDCLEILAERAMATDADRVVSYVRDVDDKGKVLQVQTLYGTIPSKWMCGLHHGTIYRKAVFSKHNIRFERAGAAEDFYVTAKFNSVCGNVEFVQQPTYNWYIHSDSTSGAKKEISPLTGINMIDSCLKSVKPIYEGLNSEDRKIFLYQILKIYCVSIYHCYQRVSIKETLAAYDKIRGLMKEFAPNYHRNTYVNLKKESPARRYAQVVVWGTITLEKLHLMPAALCGYHVAAKFHQFNI